MNNDMTINDVYPWGRTLDEYRRMFDLSEIDLRGRILSCADGPASFNAELTERGGSVISGDPLYRFSAEEIQQRVELTSDHIVALAAENRARFVWDRIASPEALREVRLAAMRRFIADYEMGRRERRYIDASLPCLEFGDGSFDIAACSHFLFLYSREFDAEFHVAALKEMARVAKDVRVFPLLDMDGKRSAHLTPVMKALCGEGFDVQVARVPYEFQRGANEMLTIGKRRQHDEADID